MALVPKIFSVSETFLYNQTNTNLATLVDLSGQSGILGALAIAPTRASSGTVSLSVLQINIDGSAVLNLSDRIALEALWNLLEEENRLIFRIPFRNSLRILVRFSRSATDNPTYATAMALVLVEE